ncbi:MAG: MgtC/SapB family protein [Clostridia bacterium]|nr:MgtC/SapB family protein [Clostridia bacterium]
MYNLLPTNLVELEYVIRMVIAVLLGFAIGLERKMRFKEAGMRTHAIVAAGACLFMIISKYGFEDTTGRFDGARLAAQVVSGIGFIGAGMIMYRKQAVHGLTTAAGVWITAGVGMAAGAGMYIVAATSTVIIIGVQCIMHINCKFFKNKQFVQLKVIFVNNNDESATVRSIFEVDKYVQLDARKQGNDIIFSVVIRTDNVPDDKFILNTLQEYPFILSIDRIDDEII